jgi:hypothetical protein
LNSATRPTGTICSRPNETTRQQTERGSTTDARHRRPKERERERESHTEIGAASLLQQHKTYGAGDSQPVSDLVSVVRNKLERKLSSSQPIRCSPHSLCLVRQEHFSCQTFCKLIAFFAQTLPILHCSTLKSDRNRTRSGQSVSLVYRHSTESRALHLLRD